METAMTHQTDPLPDTTPLWRYMKLSTFFMLLQGRAFFPTVATLQAGDPMEGALVAEPEYLLGRLKEILGDKMLKLQHWLQERADPVENDFIKNNPGMALFNTHTLARLFVQELAKRRAVWCWFNANNESAAMWSVYANAGIGVKTNVAALKQALPGNLQFSFSRIKYVGRQGQSTSYFNPESLENQDLIHRPHLVKGIEFAHEQEVRVTTKCQPFEKGTLVRGINSSTLVKEVVISPVLPYEEAKAIESVIGYHQWLAGRPVIRRSSILGHLVEQEESKAGLDEMIAGADWPRDEQGLPTPMGDL